MARTRASRSPKRSRADDAAFSVPNTPKLFAHDRARYWALQRYLGKGFSSLGQPCKLTGFLYVIKQRRELRCGKRLSPMIRYSVH